MKVLLVGSGGREHALAWKIKQSPKVSKIYAAPGNAGMNGILECVDIDVNDIDAILNFAKNEAVDLTVVGPEVPLVKGIVDKFEKSGLKIFGPSMEGAKLEGSKDFCRKICKEAGVSIAIGETFIEFEEAKNYLEGKSYPIVIKADGLAAGKGVVIATSQDEAILNLQEIMLDKKFGSSGDKIIIEEFLKGYEVSILAICSGTEALLLEPSQDHKRIFDGDKGPNTGGMGAFSPVPSFSEEQKQKVENEIILPVLRVMRDRGTPFKGVLYAGLMIDEDNIKVLEFNVRFGDPETQAVLPRLKSDLFDVLYSAAMGDAFHGFSLEWTSDACVSVVAASKGYPGNYQKGLEIKGLENVSQDSVVFHAGTSLKDNSIVTSGGRVLAVSSLGSNIKAAKEKCYETLKNISFDGIYYRNDISDKAWKVNN